MAHIASLAPLHPAEPELLLHLNVIPNTRSKAAQLSLSLEDLFTFVVGSPCRPLVLNYPAVGLVTFDSVRLKLQKKKSILSGAMSIFQPESNNR